MLRSLDTRKRFEKRLNNFAKNLIKRIRNRMSRDNINSSGSLSNSFKSFVKVYPNSYQIDLAYNDYGDFIDQGVDGLETSYNSPFQFQNDTPIPIKPLKDWVATKAPHLNPYALSKSIKVKGIKPRMFITESVEKQLSVNRLKDIADIYGDLTTEEIIRQFRSNIDLGQ